MTGPGGASLQVPVPGSRSAPLYLRSECGDQWPARNSALLLLNSANYVIIV